MKKKKRKKSAARVLRSALLCRGRVFSVRRDQVVEPSGLQATREIVLHPGSVVVLPVLPGNRIVLIRQFRYAAGQYLWELVAGHKEPGELPLEGARRELLEETGYRARHIQKLLEFFPSPGLLSERMDVFLATGLAKGPARPEEDEKISRRILSLREALRWIRSGKIRDAKSVAGILYFAAFAKEKSR